MPLEVIDYEGGPLMNRISALIKKGPRANMLLSSHIVVFNSL